MSTDQEANIDTSNVGLLTAIAVTCMLVVTTATFLRLYTRYFLLNTAGIDDWLAVVSWASVMLVGTLYLVHTRHGLGGHTWDIDSLEAFITSSKLFFAEGLSYVVALMAIKLTLFSQYYRVICQTAYRIPCLAIGAIVTAWSLGMVLMTILACIPIQASWDPTVTEKDCSAAFHGLLVAVGTIVTDFILLLMPMPIVWQLKMKAAQKISVLAIFGIGAFSCMVSVFRVTLLQPTSDFTFSGAVISCWSIGELAAGCLCSSLMTLQPLIKTVVINLSSLRRDSSRKLTDPSRSRPSIRKARSILPRNANGSEVELYSRELHTASNEGAV